MYEDIGIKRNVAIQKVYRVTNEESRHGPMSSLQAHRITTVGNKTYKNAENTPKFLDVFKEIPVSANRHKPMDNTVKQEMLGLLYTKIGMHHSTLR